MSVVVWNEKGWQESKYHSFPKKHMMGPRGADFTKYQSINKNPPPRQRVTSVMSGSSSEYGSGFEYEHFPVVCPTCQGLGKICDEGII